MFYDHRFHKPAAGPPINAVSKFWLPLVVVTAAMCLLAAGWLGVRPYTIWIGSTVLAALVLAYTLFVLISYRLTIESGRSKLDPTLEDIEKRRRISKLD